MDSNFHVERLWFPEGEMSGIVDNETYVLSMTDIKASFVEWGGVGKPKRNRVFAGDTWVLAHGQPYWSHLEEGKTCIQMSLSSNWLREVTHSSFELLPQVQLRDLLLAQMLRVLADTAENIAANPTTSLYQESLASTLVLHLVTHYGQTSEKRSDSVESVAAPLSSVRLRAISNYISERISEKISLTELAALAGLSASQFSLRFRETTGQTPHQFVTSIRVNRARELLVSGKHAPADVAALTGFADQSHLTRHVRRVFGVTPGMLQKR
jgi:AraC family transcriptional regulator